MVTLQIDMKIKNQVRNKLRNGEEFFLENTQENKIIKKSFPSQQIQSYPE